MVKFVKKAAFAGAVALLLTSCDSVGGAGNPNGNASTYENIYDTNGVGGNTPAYENTDAAVVIDAGSPGSAGSAGTAGAVTTIDATASAAPAPGVSVPVGSDSEPNFSISAAQSDFLSKVTFIGDSICSGLSLYNILPKSQVFAVGDTAARNILDPMFTFTDPVSGQKTGLMTAVSDAKPPFIAISFGMNDINITGTDVFTENYLALIDKLKEADPGVKVIAVSITPISVNSPFAYNSKIDKYNAVLKAAVEAKGAPDVIYADANSLMKNGAGDIRENLVGSTDGVHLNQGGYAPILYAVSKTAEERGFF